MELSDSQKLALKRTAFKNYRKLILSSLLNGEELTEDKFRELASDSLFSIKVFSDFSKEDDFFDIIDTIQYSGYTISDGNAEFVIRLDSVKFYYNDVEQFGSTFLYGDMYLDLSEWTLIEDSVSGAQEETLVDETLYEVDYPVLQYTPGSGSFDETWIPISTVAQLQLIGNDESYPINGKYYLTTNIDCSSVENFTPIGFVSDTTNIPLVLSDSFQGTFDGDGYTITNCSVDIELGIALGVFGILLNATVRNLGLVEPSITGYATIGSIAGAMIGTSSVINCYCDGGSVTSSFESESYISTGLVATISTGLGGTRTISNCYSTCDVVCHDVSGIIGYFEENTTVENCYFAGTLSYYDAIGYMHGISKSSGAVDCFWDTEVSGAASSNSGTGKTTTQMKTESTYTNWDFDNDWEMGVGDPIYGSAIYIAADGQRKIRINTIDKTITANSFGTPMKEIETEDDYFTSADVLYFQVCSYILEKYQTWLSIDGDVVYLLGYEPPST